MNIDEIINNDNNIKMTSMLIELFSRGKFKTISEIEYVFRTVSYFSKYVEIRTKFQQALVSVISFGIMDTDTVVELINKYDLHSTINEDLS